MFLEVLLILPLYVGIFALFFRFRFLIKAMTELNEIFSDMFFEGSAEEVSKRDFLMEKIKNGESISNSETPWTAERLEKASEKVIDKLYEKLQNPLPIKINKNEALEMGLPVCPVVVEMYAEGLKNLMERMPYVGKRYTINTEKLKESISSDKYFCDNLAIEIGSKMIEHMGKNPVARVGASLAAKTWNAVEILPVINERQSISGNLLSTGEPLDREESDDRAS